MIRGESSFISGARQILLEASDAGLDESDPDLVVFVGIVSETELR